MADKQQLVYEINIIANGTDKIEGVKKSLEGAKDFVDKLNNANVNIGVNDNFKSNLHTITQDLHEVKRGIELLNKGASIKVNGVEQTEQTLRSLEKTLEDTLKNIKANSFNSLVQDMTKLQEAALKDDAAIDKLLKKYEQLTRTFTMAAKNQKLIPESTWYNRRDSLDAVIAKLKEYGIVRDNIYRSEQYSTHKTSVEGYIELQKRRLELENQIEKVIDRQTVAMERGQQVKKADFDLSMKQLQQLIAKYNKLGGTKTFTSPFSAFKTSEEQNKAVMKQNVEAWSTGLKTYSQELSRLMALQEQMYILWRHDGTQEARENLNKLAASIAKVRAEQEAYQQATNSPKPAINNNQTVDQTKQWAEGIQSYTRELRRLEEVQQKAFAVWKSDPTAANKLALDNVKASLASVRKEYEEFQKTIGKAGENINRTSGYFTSFTQKLRSHLYWITAGSLLGAAFAVPTETFNSLVQLDEEMHNLATVMPQLEGQSEEAIKKYQTEQRKLINTASEYGASVKDVMESARLWGRMYKDQATVNTLVSQSAKLAVADNFSMAESTKAVEAAMFQYGLVAKNSAEALAYSNKIVDVYTKLSHNAGVSAQDLAAGVERSGSVAKQAGISFEFLNALIAQGTRATALSGAEIGNMLKTMLASFNSDKAVKELNKLGIATTETVNGVKKVRSAQAVLMDVAVAAQGTNKDLKDLWIQMSGGKFQWAKAAAMFSNYQEIIKNWGLAVNSMGFTDNQVKNQMDSLSRRINKLKADLTGMVAQGGNSGLTQWLKECVTELDNLAKFLSTVSTSTYHFIGSFTKLLMIMYLVNKAMRLLRTSLNMITASGAAATITSMSTAFASATTTAEGLKAAIIALKNSISLLKAAATFGASLVIDLGLEALTGYIDNTTNAVEKQTEAVSNDVAVKRQQIEMYNQQEDYLDALFVAHQKLTAEIESSTISDEKKKKLLEDRIETENQMANVVGWSAVQQMQADNWTDASTKKVRDNYVNATEAKKKSLAQFLSAKQQEAVENYRIATENMQNWKEETDQFCRATGDKINALNEYVSALHVVSALEEKFHQFQKSTDEGNLEKWKERQYELSQLQSDPNHEWTQADQDALDTVNNTIGNINGDINRLNDAIYEDRYNIKWEESGKELAKKEEAARNAFQNIGGANLVNPGGVMSPDDFLQKWGSGEGAGGDEYNHTPTTKQHHERKKKDPNYVKEDWQYGDTTSQMFAELSKKFESKFDTKNGLDMATLSAIVTKLTGINTLDFDGVSDPFGTGGRNTWESGRLFYQKMAPYLAQGLSVSQALGHLTPGITDEEWKVWLDDKALYLRNKYNYTKNDQRFSDPNEQAGGLYDLGGAPTSGGGDEDYVGNDVDEGHLWELAVIAANQAKVVKDPLYYWLIMMHESGRGKDGTSVANHNFAGLGGGSGVDMQTDANFAKKFSEVLDGMFNSAPNSVGELVYGMYTHHYFTGDAEAYQSDLEGIKNEGLIGGSNNQTTSASSAPIGDAVYDEALKESAERKGQALGANTCAAFVSYVTRGIGANTGIDDPLVKNWVDKAQASGAWVDSSSGQTAPKGSLVVWSREGEQDGNPWMHIGISDGQGGWISSDTHGLKHHTGLDSYYSGNGYNYAGYIDMAKLTGGQTVSGYATPKKPSFWDGRKSTLADFTRDQIAETIYDQDRQQKLYESRKKNIEYQMKVQGETYELLRANDANEKAYYEAMEKNRKGWIDSYDKLTDDISDYLDDHVEIKNKLDGKNIFDMPQDELKKLADLSKDDEFKKFIDNLFKIREQLNSSENKLMELRAAEKIRNGYMTPEQDEDYRLKRLDEWYNRTTSNKTDGEKYTDTHEYYQAQLEIYEERRARQTKALMDIRRRDQEQLEDYYNQIDELEHGKRNDKGEVTQNGLDQYKGDSSDEAKDKIAELKAKIKDLKENTDQLAKHGSENFQKVQKEVEDTEAKIREIAEKDNEVTKNLWDTIENDIDDMFYDIIKQGGSFKESWKKLWDDVAKIALQQIMRMTVNKWLFKMRTTIDDAIDNRNAGKNAVINGGFGLASNLSMSRYTSPKRWNQVATGNRYLDMANGVTNGNYFPMNQKANASSNDLKTNTKVITSATNRIAAGTAVNKTLEVANQASKVAIGSNTASTTRSAVATDVNTNTQQENSVQMSVLGTKIDNLRNTIESKSQLQGDSDNEVTGLAGTVISAFLADGGSISSRLLTAAYANGGSIPGYASAGLIRGAGTGKSDSILAYLANKDKFVYLSNGEYVMTEEATNRIGKDNLDAMNYGKFADGGALNPTPYVPQISPRIARRAENITPNNPNARMEKLMQEQTDTIRNMGNSDGSGNVIVLNTHASSDDVMNAIQKNPRAFQAIMHNQKRHGFR